MSNDSQMPLASSGLFAVPSFIGGAAQLFDVAGTLSAYNTSETPQKADRGAIVRDWLVVEADLIAAQEKLAAEC